MMILGAILLLASSASAFPLGRSISNTLGGIITGKSKLTFNAAGNFKVVSFSDMHMGEQPAGTEVGRRGGLLMHDAATQVVHGTVLDNDHLSYDVFNGDMIGENVFKANATNYLGMVYAPTVARSIPFSSTHGNHDNANDINHREEIEYEQAHYAHLTNYIKLQRLLMTALVLVEGPPALVFVHIPMQKAQILASLFVTLFQSQSLI
ncbi:hypothetical protein B0H14DRAFT_3594612 [Mycena olivaceomarginata]|nr:hypothetical protein B0H14DRAFT_3594612 [Mycena olivaceomarginata]